MTAATEQPVETKPADQPSVDKSESRIRKMFGEISPRYDFLNHFLSGGTDWYWRWRTVRAVCPSGSEPILDVCTGTGDLALAYWKKARRLVPVIGADFTHEMLTRADLKGGKAFAKTKDAAGLTFIEADAQRLPFADDRFQIVSVAFGLRNVTNTERGLREMVRVCKPGGRVAVLEFSMPRNRVFGAIYRWYFRNILPRLGQLFMRNSHAAYQYLPDSVSEFPQGEQLTALMQQCGLDETTFRSLTFGIATLYVGHKPE